MRYPLFSLLRFEMQVFRCGNFVKHLDKQAVLCYTNPWSRGSGGTGRRARLRGVWITPYGFKSRLPHQTKAASFWMVPLFLVWMQGLEGCVLEKRPVDVFPELRKQSRRHRSHPQPGKSRLPHQNTGIAHRVMPVFFDLCETGLEGPGVNDCRWQSEPATAPPTGGQVPSSVGSFPFLLYILLFLLYN